MSKEVKYVSRDLSFVVMKTFSPSSIHLASSGINVSFKKMAAKVATEDISDLDVKSISLGNGTCNNTYAALCVKVSGEVGMRPIVNTKGSSFVMADNHDPVAAHAIVDKNERLLNKVELHVAENNKKPFRPSESFSTLTPEDYITEKGKAWKVDKLYHISDDSPFIEFLVFQRVQDVIEQYQLESKEVITREKLEDLEAQAKRGVILKLKKEYEFSEGKFRMPAHYVHVTLDLIKKSLSSALTVETALNHIMINFNRVRPSTRGEWDSRDDAELFAATSYEESSKEYLHNQSYTLQVELIITVDYPVNKFL